LQSSSVSKAAHGEFANAAGQPMDIARRIFAENGFAGFFKGLKPTLVGIIPARSLYFYAYGQTKSTLGKTGLVAEGTDLNAIISGFAAGVVSNTATNPIWMVKTRMQLLADHTAGQVAYKGYQEAIGAIFKEEGIGGFYRGLSASYWGCTEGAIQFLLYERIKGRLTEVNNAKRELMGLPPTDQLPKMTYFFSAAFAKGCASVLTYPHEVARTRLREQARNGVFKYNGMWNAIGIIAKEEGRSGKFQVLFSLILITSKRFRPLISFQTLGLYAGMGVHLAKVVPNSAIMFLAYEVVNTWLGTFTPVE
jgi:solute carrier family 25 protein 33/36